jgi:glutamyl-tRNA reductase
MLMIGMMGIDHHVASADVRGRVRFTGDQLPAALRALVAGPAIDEAIIVSTCNRTEVYFATANWQAATARVRRLLATAFLYSADSALTIVPLCRPPYFAACDGPYSWLVAAQLYDQHDAPLPEVLAMALYTSSELEAVQHLFRVASGLRSLVVGETQILGQVKEALSEAEAARTAGSELRTLFISAIKVAKRVHDVTGIGHADRSVAGMAIEVAEQLLGDLQDVATLLIGAGRTSQLCAQRLRAARAGPLTLANRSPHAAQDLARSVDGAAITLDELARVIPNVALIICATAAPHTVLHAATLAEARKGGHSPVLILDLAIPCDVDPDAARLPGVSLYTLDTLCALTKTDAAERTTQRETELARAEEIVAAGIVAFARERMRRSAGPSISALRQHIDSAAAEEFKRALAQLGQLSAAERAIVERFGHRLAGKLFHHLVSRISSLVEDDTLSPDVTLHVLTRLFPGACTSVNNGSCPPGISSVVGDD